MTPYYDPVARLGLARGVFAGSWETGLWLNVPGPLYGGETDTCWTGASPHPATCSTGATT
ncbi:hypothetical protein [Streptomyces sp. UNC401CLCol]|uniref:hypothetical protein n=1 Tax=Streptomyces sp. UNC401CLCol TaxID=1449077 RepID=UPI000A4CC66D